MRPSRDACDWEPKVRRRVRRPLSPRCAEWTGKDREAVSPRPDRPIDPLDDDDELDFDEDNVSVGVAFASGAEPVQPDAPAIDMEPLIGRAVAEFRRRGYSEAWIQRELEEFRRATGRDEPA
jgi:hypothetical protein